jgi:hypothetical protein
MKTFFFERVAWGIKKIHPFTLISKKGHLTFVKSAPKKSFAQKTDISGTFFNWLNIF